MTTPPPDPTGSASAAPPESLQVQLERLQFYRAEIRHEFDLLSSRVSAYITSQSFLVTGFALSLGNMNPHWGDLFRLLFPPALAILGIASSLLVWPGIHGACVTIDLWHDKQERMLAHDPRLEAYRIVRSVVRPGQGDPIDLIHRRSLLFARWSPWLFTIAWSLFGALALILAFREQAGP